MFAHKHAARPGGCLLFILLAIFTSRSHAAAANCDVWLVRGGPFAPAQGRPGDFDGSTPLPLGVHMVVEGVTYLSRPGTFRMEFDIAAISAQSESLRELLLEIKRQTLAHAPEREREFGAAIIERENGRVEVVKFTSNLIQEIKQRDMVIAGLGPYSTASPRGVKRLTPIHTHPNQANPRVTMRWTFPGPKDYAVLRDLREEWKRVHGKSIEVIGIVLPTGPNLDDVLYRYE